MTAESNKALFRRVIDEILVEGNLALLDELFSPDFIDHSPIQGVTTDFDGLRHSARTLRSAFPDLRITIDYIVADADSVAAHMTIFGTHQGEFMGVLPTGRQVAFAVQSILRFVDGHIVERWSSSDRVEIWEQFGVYVSPTAPT